MRHIFVITSLTVLLSACTSPYGIPPYAALQTNSSTISAIGARNVGLGKFEEVPFDRSCRGLHSIALPDDLSPAQYIRKALELELRNADAGGGAAPQITLSGKLETISFSSTAAITMGHWALGLTLRSSNGKLLQVSEHFEFDSGFHYVEACKNVAEAFPKAVQGLIGKAVSSPGFPELLARDFQ